MSKRAERRGGNGERGNHSGGCGEVWSGELGEQSLDCGASIIEREGESLKDSDSEWGI